MTDDSAGGSDEGPPDEGRSGGPGERLVEEIAKHDEDLAADVRRIIERGAELHEELEEAKDELEERDARVEELEATLEEHSGEGAFEWAGQRNHDHETASGDREAASDDHEAASGDQEAAGDADAETAEGDETPDGDASEERTDDATSEATGDDADPGRIEELEAELAQRERRVEELETELARRDERIQELSETLDEREDEIEDLTERLKRKQADFQNYKKRAERKREDIKERATEDLVERLLDVRDNLRRAVENDHENVASLLDGVEMTLREFDRVLEDENVTEIAPEPGSEIDPSKHEVMMRVDSDQPTDTVADVYAPGYEMAGKVIRAAKVTVSTGPAEDDGEAADPADAEDAEGDAAAATANDE